MIEACFRKKYVAVVTIVILIFVNIFFSGKVRAAEEENIPAPVSAKVYSSTSDNSDIIANLIVGNVFEITGNKSDDAGAVWYEVKTDFGAEGYAKASEVDRLIEQAQALQQIMAENAVNTEVQTDNSGNDNETVQEGNDNVEDAETGNNADDNVEDTKTGSDADDNVEDAKTGSDADDNVEDTKTGSDADDNAETIMTEDESETQEISENNQAEPTAKTEYDIKMPSNTNNNLLENRLSDNGTAAIDFGVTKEIKSEDTKNLHKQGIFIDTVFIAIIAGGILCITAIVILIKKILMCLRKGR